MNGSSEGRRTVVNDEGLESSTLHSQIRLLSTLAKMGLAH